MPTNLPHQREFLDVLPLLVTTYMRGRLVPFLGAGMSIPKLAAWKEFVHCLESEAHVPGAVNGEPGENLDVRAQRACDRIRYSHGSKGFTDSVRRALRGTSEEVPAQTTSLASIRWPLVVSTNYDDLYFGSCLRTYASHRGGASQGEAEVEVVGRSPKDCKKLLAALHGPFDRQYIWHVQGFLGGQFGDKVEDSVADLDALQQQLVIGHAQYRSITNASPHFRRCFGAMFSSRSFLFLGSSLSEDYFLNLFGEVLELCGPSAVPHFAFMRKGTVDAHFLADQMNITVCEYDKHEDVAAWLDCLNKEIKRPRVKNTSWSFTTLCQTGFQCGLDIVRGEVSLHPNAHRAIAIAVRRNKDDVPVLPEKYLRLRGEQLPPHTIIKHVVQYGDEPFYAVTARCTGKEDDTAVASAVEELLDAADRRIEEGKNGKAVHLQLSASRGSVPPVYAFVESVRAFGEWKRKNHKSHLTLILHIKSDVAFNLTSERIDIQELLSSELVRFWVVVVPGQNEEPTRHILHYKKETLLSEVLSDLDVPCEEEAVEWHVSLCPRPRRHMPPRTTWSLRDSTLQSIGVVFGSILTLECAGSQQS